MGVHGMVKSWTLYGFPWADHIISIDRGGVDQNSEVDAAGRFRFIRP